MTKPGSGYLTPTRNMRPDRSDHTQEEAKQFCSQLLCTPKTKKFIRLGCPYLLRDGAGESNSKETESDWHKPQVLLAQHQNKKLWWACTPVAVSPEAKPCAPPCQHRRLGFLREKSGNYGDAIGRFPDTSSLFKPMPNPQ